METFYKIKSRFGEFSKYKISKNGSILCWNYLNTNSTGILKESLHKDGYSMVFLYDDNGKRHTIKVHTLVADTFIPNPNDYTEINHIDENKTNNNINNLEWCTKEYTNTYAEKAKKIGLKLRNNERSKPVIAYCDDNTIEFPSIREAARFLGNPRADSNIHSGIKTGKMRFGYYWKYKNDEDNQQPSLILDKGILKVQRLGE